MSFTTITYNFYCTVSVFILSGYPRSASVRSRGWTYIKVRLCINQLYDPYIWRTLFWYFAVDKETTFTLTLAPQSRQNPIGIFFSYASFEFTGEHSEKRHYRRRRFAFVPIYVCIPCLIGLTLCRAQFVSIFDFKRKRDSNPHGLWSTPAATSTHHLIIKVANFNYNSICYQDRYLRGSRLYQFVYSFLLSTEGISSRSP